MFLCRLTFILWLVAYIFKANAQNLVPNPGFESLRQNPCQIISSPFIDNVNKYALDWVSPTNGTSDIHTNKAQPDTICKVGLNRTGYAAHSGEACAGLFTVNPSPRVAMATKQKP